MPTLKSILVPVDFSDLAAESYRFALRFAGEMSASVHLLYCLPSVAGAKTHPDIFQSMTQELMQTAEKNLKAFREEGLNRVKTRLGTPPTVTGSVSVFGLRESIDKQVEKKAIDLVLLSTHGVHDAWDRLFGTNATFLVGKIATPLLILPSGEEFRPFKSICFATDFRDCDLKNAMSLFKAFYPFLPRMHFLHVQQPEEKPPAEGIGFFRRAFERPQSGMEATFAVVTDRDITDGIFGHLAAQKYDLLVMTKPNRTWLQRLFSHSETRESAGITSIPLLILGERVWD